MKRVLTLGVVALAVLAVVAGPAGATGETGTRAPSATCWNAGDGSFGLTGFLTAAANARGPIVRERASDDKPNEVPHSPAAGPNFEATVPIYFHVISPDGVDGQRAPLAIQEQVDVMNATFGGLRAAPTTGFAFTLAGVDRTDNAAWFNAGDCRRARMKKALHSGGADAPQHLHDSGYGFLGWAYFPTTYDAKAVHRRHRHRLRLDAGRATRTPTGTTSARRPTHEAGHWLGLYHTFQGGCNDYGDYVDDTPAELVADVRLPRGPGHVPGAGPRPDPQLHGLLVRLLLHAVHAGSGHAHAGSVAVPYRRFRRPQIRREGPARVRPPRSPG